MGTLDELLVDDDAWTVRWLVADTGGWLEDRRTLVSPLAVVGVDHGECRVTLRLTRAQVEASPPISRHQPVSRRNEVALHEYYGWPYYWGGVGSWGPMLTPAELVEAPPPDPGSAPGEGALAGGDPHLQSTRDLVGQHIMARDGDIGHVDDLLYDERTWRVERLVVDTRNWLPGRKVAIAPDQVEEIDPAAGVVQVSLTRDGVRAAPAPEHGEPGA